VWDKLGGTATHPGRSLDKRSKPMRYLLNAVLRDIARIPALLLRE
jgi:hypothetical protein